MRRPASVVRALRGRRGHENGVTSGAVCGEDGATGHAGRSMRRGGCGGVRRGGKGTPPSVSPPLRTRGGHWHGPRRHVRRRSWRRRRNDRTARGGARRSVCAGEGSEAVCSAGGRLSICSRGGGAVRSAPRESRGKRARVWKSSVIKETEHPSNQTWALSRQRKKKSFFCPARPGPARFLFLSGPARFLFLSGPARPDFFFCPARPGPARFLFLPGPARPQLPARPGPPAQMSIARTRSPQNAIASDPAAPGTTRCLGRVERRR